MDPEKTRYLLIRHAVWAVMGAMDNLHSTLRRAQDALDGDEAMLTFYHCARALHAFEESPEYRAVRVAHLKDPA